MKNCAKYISQFGIILGCAFFGELARALIPVGIPACVYSIGALFFLLWTRVVKPEWIRETAYFLIFLFPLCFVAPTVGVVEHFGEIKAMLPPLIAVLVFTTALCAAVTGRVCQYIIGRSERKGLK